MVIGAVPPLFNRLVGPSIDEQRELGGTFRMSRRLGRIAFVVFGAFVFIASVVSYNAPSSEDFTVPRGSGGGDTAAVPGTVFVYTAFVARVDNSVTLISAKPLSVSGPASVVAVRVLRRQSDIPFGLCSSTKPSGFHDTLAVKGTTFAGPSRMAVLVYFRVTGIGHVAVRGIELRYRTAAGTSKRRIVKDGYEQEVEVVASQAEFGTKPGACNPNGPQTWFTPG
ncbi:MAG: hypothetical protein QOG03_2377 [Actinomycetota bacterium]|nr:hypothetical protein [Actinomycetota bacterium]